MMLVLFEGWNYVMELYFWVILAAILLVSMTILLARPSHSKYLETQSYDLEEATGTEEISEGIDNPDEMDDQEEEEESFSKNAYIRANTEYKRNDKVTVKYNTSGKVLKDIKNKKVEKDIELGKCYII